MKKLNESCSRQISSKHVGGLMQSDLGHLMLNRKTATTNNFLDRHIVVVVVVLLVTSLLLHDFLLPPLIPPTHSCSCTPLVVLSSSYQSVVCCIVSSLLIISHFPPFPVLPFLLFYFLSPYSQRRYGMVIVVVNTFSLLWPPLD